MISGTSQKAVRDLNGHTLMIREFLTDTNEDAASINICMHMHAAFL